MPASVTATKRRVAEQRRAIGQEIRLLREDAGITQARLARAAGVSRAHLCGIESGESEASLAALTGLSDALGASVSIRLYPGTGPRIRDHLQAGIVEAILRHLNRRWKRFLEVPVYRPVRVSSTSCCTTRPLGRSSRPRCTPRSGGWSSFFAGGTRNATRFPPRSYGSSPQRSRHRPSQDCSCCARLTPPDPSSNSTQPHSRRRFRRRVPAFGVASLAPPRGRDRASFGPRCGMDERRSSIALREASRSEGRTAAT